MPKGTALKINKLEYRARFDISTFDAAENTIEVTFATETTDVLRYDWRTDTVFIEQLVLDKGAVRMDRINAGAPFLNSHDRWSGVDSVLGVIESAEIKDKVGRAKIRLSKREDLKPIIEDIKAGILRNVSVGYTVYKYERQPVVDGEKPVYRAIDWEPSEISLVSVPADYNCSVRQQTQDGKTPNTFEVEVIDSVRAADPPAAPTVVIPENQNNNNNLTNQTMYEARAAAVGLPKDATLAQIEAAEKIKTDAERAAKIEGAKEELERQSLIREAVSKSKLPPEFADPFIKDGKNIGEVRAAIIDKLAETKDPGVNGAAPNLGADRGDEKRIKGITASLLIRSNHLVGDKVTDEERTLANDYSGMSLMDLAKDSLIRAGVNISGMDKHKIVSLALNINPDNARSITSHTSDFPVLLEGTNRRILLGAYKSAADTWRIFCSTGSVGDFREYKRLRPGSLTRLDGLLEGAEYKVKKLSDATSEKVKVDTYGNIINISRQMIINDDLGAFTRLSKDLGRAAARNIEEDVYTLLQLNSGLGPTLTDGITLFHADHKNLISAGGAPSVTEFDKVRQLMRKQTDNDANEFLDIMASIWVGPVNLGGLARVVNDSKYDPDAANKLERPNMVAGMYQNIVDTPRLTEALPWYTFADPNEEPVIEVSFLDGQQNPHMESQIPFEMDGIQWKVRHDYGVGAIGYRGGVRNAGTGA